MNPGETDGESGRRRRRWLWLPMIAMLLALVALPVAVLRDLPDSPPLDQVWMATFGTYGRIERMDHEVAALFFERSTSYMLGTVQLGDAVPSMSWADESAFERDLAAGVIPAQVRAVMYDPEYWPATPVDQQQHPVAAMQAFSEAARTAGYRVVITPHPNLVEVPGGDCVARADEVMERAFLRCGIPGQAAALADVVEVQAQFLEEQPDYYGQIVGVATSQARDANPDVVVLSGLSTRFAATPEILLDAWTAVHDVVDGHYLAMPEGIRPWVGARFLGLVAQTDETRG